MSAATAPAAKQAMLTIFAAAAGLSGVATSWDAPTKDEDFREELIWLGDVDGSEDWAMLGNGTRDESYTVEVGVYVEQFGDDPQGVETRAWAIWNAATDALRTDLRTGTTLRAAGVLKYDSISFRQRSAPASPEKWGARIDGTVSFLARNT